MREQQAIVGSLVRNSTSVKVEFGASEFLKQLMGGLFQKDRK